MSNIAYFIRNLRYATIKLQKAFRIFYNRKLTLDKVLYKYLLGEGDIDECLDNTKILFPNIPYPEDIETDEFFEIKPAAKQLKKEKFLDFHPHAEPKINLFAKIVDIDFIVRTIYNR
jgi:hypothetical protein